MLYYRQKKNNNKVPFDKSPLANQSHPHVRPELLNLARLERGKNIYCQIDTYINRIDTVLLKGKEKNCVCSDFRTIIPIVSN